MRRVDFLCCYLIASRSQIGELNFPDHAHVAVYLALDLILKHAAGLGQLAHHDVDLAAVDELAVLGTKRDPLTDDEFVRWHVHLRRRLEMRSSASLCGCGERRFRSADPGSGAASRPPRSSVALSCRA